jgi:integrase
VYFDEIRWRTSDEIGQLQPKDLKKGFLSIERQLRSNVDDNKLYKPLKSRFTRKTPHWFCTPAMTYELIQGIENLTLNSDHISHLFSDLMEKLNLPNYVIHDLRRTFITNCVRKGIAREELRLAVGHVDSSTTDKYYVMDIRDIDGEIWKPDKNESA